MYEYFSLTFTPVGSSFLKNELYLTRQPQVCARKQLHLLPAMLPYQLEVVFMCCVIICEGLLHRHAFANDWFVSTDEMRKGLTLPITVILRSLATVCPYLF